MPHRRLRQLMTAGAPVACVVLVATGRGSPKDLIDADAQQVGVSVRLQQFDQPGQGGRFAVRRLVLNVEYLDTHLAERPNLQDGQLLCLDVDVDIVDDSLQLPALAPPLDREVLCEERFWGQHLDHHRLRPDALGAEERVVDGGGIER
eukprot:CAMPEP_0181221026 /NCGR_PEP_ID=MMETSP1096-20121128/29162_1 /TAXON_ID=156174 ORGANISM="Chrysochromulina ericina, Strain CCMP281" /NCGR_SAMPLE_ID=MMETSP1096 /ASSEMBLY_ACC=CAM_ASM_000453 /LENGTH=147 /DNA_ID=CAMNT_0023313591 /DNA_START=324 /DNA_END=767 /DNA_ORIENTATION=-